ncbi:MAG: hypothetical protein L0Z62_39740 [Gemmataceae bacterium]|nr:hypothetical protein [Gemmataceae bacterium]
MSGKNLRYLAVSLLWAAAFTVVAAVLAGFGSGLLFAAWAADGANPARDAELINGVARVWHIAPLVGCAVALFLCVFSRLPGTRLADAPSRQVERVGGA